MHPIEAANPMATVFFHSQSKCQLSAQCRWDSKKRWFNSNQQLSKVVHRSKTLINWRMRRPRGLIWVVSAMKVLVKSHNQNDYQAKLVLIRIKIKMIGRRLRRTGCGKRSRVVCAQWRWKDGWDQAGSKIESLPSQKYTNTQYTNTQTHDTQIHNYTNTQIHCTHTV